MMPLFERAHVLTGLILNRTAPNHNIYNIYTVPVKALFRSFKHRF